MSSHARQILPLGAASRKRKERESSCGFRAQPNTTKVEPAKQVVKPTVPAPPKLPALPSKNRLLAGYLAHEFLTRGTLFGEPFEQRAAAARAEPDKPKPAAYADVAYLLKFDGTHIAGVVNPTQLGSWIQQKSLNT